MKVNGHHGRLVHWWTLPTQFCGGTCPGIYWSQQARGPCSLSVAGRRYLPGFDRRIHVVLPSERLQPQPFCHGQHCLTSAQQRPCFVTVSFPSLWPWRGLRACSEAGTLCMKPCAWHLSSSILLCGILAVALGRACLLFMTDAQLEPTLPGRSRVEVHCFPLEISPNSGNRTFLALKSRGHLVTLCCGHDGNFCVLELGHQMLISLGASMLSMIYFLSSRVEGSHCSTCYSGYAWPHSRLTASWCLRGPSASLIRNRTVHLMLP